MRTIHDAPDRAAVEYICGVPSRPLPLKKDPERHAGDNRSPVQQPVRAPGARRPRATPSTEHLHHWPHTSRLWHISRSLPPSVVKIGTARDPADLDDPLILNLDKFCVAPYARPSAAGSILTWPALARARQIRCMPPDPLLGPARPRVVPPPRPPPQKTLRVLAGLGKPYCPE